MARVLVTGAGGQLGRALAVAAVPPGLEIHGFDRSRLDVTDARAVASAIPGFDCVINAAAYTAVDKAETEPKRARVVNALAPAILAEVTAVAGVPIIHVSTDYVFGGAGTRPWREDDLIDPINVYGATKASGEEAVRSANPRHVILRTSWVYGNHGHNFVRTMLRLGHDGSAVRVVDDQIGTPTSARDLADAIFVVAARLLAGAEPPYGTFHYTAIGWTSWYGFADAVFSEAENHRGWRPKLVAISTRDYPAAARRPANSVLDCSSIMETFAPNRRPWREGNSEAVSEILNTETEGSW